MSPEGMAAGSNNKKQIVVIKKKKKQAVTIKDLFSNVQKSSTAVQNDWTIQKNPKPDILVLSSDDGT